MATLLILLLVLLFFSGAPLYAVLIAATGISALYGPPNPREFGQEFGGNLLTTYGSNIKSEAIVFTTIPLFIYAGYIMAAAKTSDRLVRFANALMGWMPGGLAVVTIFACAIFTIFTGASGVTIVALGALVMPSLLKQGYPKQFSLGLVTGTGSVGLLFPPALPLFVFATVYGLQASALKDKKAAEDFANPADLDRMLDAVTNWDTERFVFAGVLPGLILVACLAVVAIVSARRAMVPRQSFEVGELGRSFVAVLPELMLPLVVLVPLVNGWADIGQLAAVVVVYLVVIEMFVYRDIRPITLWKISGEALALIGTIFLIVYVSTAFTNALYTAEVPQALVGWAKENIDNKFMFLLLLNLLLLVVGMMMDIFSAVLIVVPLIAPVAYYYGIDPYHLGVIFLMNLELGYVTPPVGLNLFIASFKFQQPVPVVVRASLPFLGAMVVALVLVTYVPALTWVPPPKPTGTLQALRNSVEEGVQFVTTSSMTLASGQAVAKADCEAMEAEPRERCLELFSYFGECRAKPQAERAGCEREWTATYQAEFVPVTQVTLPDDKVLARADCAAAPERAKAACEEAFDELPACVKTTLTAGARLGRECELGKVAPYVAAVTGVASIALPGGVLERAACERARGEDAPDRCVEFFDDELVECLALEIAGDAAGAAGCRQEKVEGYVEEMGPTGLVMQDE